MAFEGGFDEPVEGVRPRLQAIEKVQGDGPRLRRLR
jgi:hypothetical protein